MAKNNKGKQFYVVTREKPAGKIYVLLMGGSMGAVISFFIVSVLGTFYGTEMDDLVFFFILFGILGFFVGVFLTSFFIFYFSKVIAASSVVAMEKPTEETLVEHLETPNLESAMPAEETEKGQSVDFVFPELSPDK
jgi:hypothetical protein